MKRRTHELSTFFKCFFQYLLVVREIIVGLLLLILLGAVAISILEEHTLGESIYFSFITGLSVGYGDISPKTPWGRVVCVAMGLVGMLFVGLTVAVATRALADTVKQLDDENR